MTGAFDSDRFERYLRRMGALNAGRAWRLESLRTLEGLIARHALTTGDSIPSRNPPVYRDQYEATSIPDWYGPYVEGISVRGLEHWVREWWRRECMRIEREELA